MMKYLLSIGFVALNCVGCTTIASSSPIEPHDEDAVIQCVGKRLQPSVAEWLKRGVNGYGKNNKLSPDELEDLAFSVPNELRDIMSISTRLALKGNEHDSMQNYNYLNDEVIRNFISIAPKELRVSMCGKHAGEILYADAISAFGTILYPGYANSNYAKHLIQDHGVEAPNYYGNFLFLWLSLKFAGLDPGFEYLSNNYRPSRSTGKLFIK